MKKHATWLHAAVRAHQAQTFDHMQRAQQARDELSAAVQLASQSDQALVALSESWTAQRRSACSSQELDGAYRRFHEFLRGKAEAASEAQQSRRTHVEAVMTDLQKSHAVQRTLEKVARQAAERRQREAGDKESKDAAEAWLLGRFAHLIEPGRVRSQLEIIGESPQGNPSGRKSDDVHRQ